MKTMPSSVTSRKQTPAATSRGRPADPRLQGRFIDAVLDILVTEGYRAVTTAAVAQRAGASTASLYRRWPTKKALVADVARTLTLEGLGRIDTGTLSGDLCELITRKRRLFEHVGTALLALLAEAGHDQELREILHQEVFEATTQRTQALLDGAADRGEITYPAPETVRVLSLVILGSGLIQQALLPASPPGQDDPAVGAEVALILRGLTAPVADG